LRLGAGRGQQPDDCSTVAPTELTARLGAVGVSAARYPYSFFTPEMRAMLTARATAGDKPAAYRPPRLFDPRPAREQAQ